MLTTQEQNILNLSREGLRAELSLAQSKGCIVSLANQMKDLRPSDRGLINVIVEEIGAPNRLQDAICSLLGQGLLYSEVLELVAVGFEKSDSDSPYDQHELNRVGGLVRQIKAMADDNKIKTSNLAQPKPSARELEIERKFNQENYDLSY